MDLLKIKIKDTMARVTLREYLDSHDIMYFTKKKSVYVKPETGNAVLSYLDLSGVEYDSKFKSDVDISDHAFKVFQPTEEIRNILQNKKTDIPTRTQDTMMDNVKSENEKEESAEQEDSFDDEVLRKIDAGEALAEKVSDELDKLDKVKSLLHAHTDFSRETPEVNYELVAAMFHILGLERDQDKENTELER